jgi:hypothetical protein
VNEEFIYGTFIKEKIEIKNLNVGLRRLFHSALSLNLQEAPPV